MANFACSKKKKEKWWEYYGEVQEPISPMLLYKHLLTFQSKQRHCNKVFHSLKTSWKKLGVNLRYIMICVVHVQFTWEKYQLFEDNKLFTFTQCLTLNVFTAIQKKKCIHFNLTKGGFEFNLIFYKKTMDLIVMKLIFSQLLKQ